MSDDLKIITVAIIGLLALLFGFAAAATAPGLIRSQQRYATFLESQRAVLECRAIVASGRDVDDICGAIPTLKDFN